MKSLRAAFRYVPPAGHDSDIAVADGWVSYAPGAPVASADVPADGRFELAWDARPEDPVPLDAALHVQLWRPARLAEAPFAIREPAGYAQVLLVDLVGERPVRTGVRVVAFTAYDADRASAPRGELEARIVGGAVGSWAEPSSLDFVPANAASVAAILDAETRRANALGDPQEQAAAGVRVEFTSAIMERVRMRYYVTGPARLPGFLLFRNLNRPAPPDLRIVEHHLVAAAERAGWTADGLAGVLASVLAAAPLDDHHVLALDALAAGLTLACVSMTYVGDYAPDARGRNRQVELYGDVLRWYTGDCEDFAALIAWLALSVQRLQPPDDCPLVRAAHAVLQRYVVAGCSMTVQGAQLSDAKPLASSDGAGAHMQCTLWPRGFWLACLRRVAPGAEMPPGLPEPGGEPDLPPVQLEGTGDMFAVQTPARHLPAGPAHRLAVWMDDVDAAYHYVFNPSAYGRGADPSLVNWRQRRLPHRGGGREGLTNDFYRQYRMVVAAGYGVPEWSVGGRPANPCQFDVGTTRRIDGTTTNFSIGAPSYDVNAAADTTLLATAPAPTPEGRAVFARAGRHLQPVAPFARRDCPPDVVFEQAARMRAALGPGCADRPLPFSARGPVLVTFALRHAYVAHTPWQADLVTIGHLPGVSRVALYVENVLAGLYNYVLQLYVTPPPRSDAK